jgi:hypothetical protein
LVEVEARSDAAAETFARYPELVAEIVAILENAKSVDEKVHRVNAEAPAGEHRRLLE